jgi:hypothetical protein
VRALIYAMPSSGASLFTSFLAQTHDSIAIVDLWSLAPPLTAEFPVIVKATINCEITFEDHCGSFGPDLRILFLRDPRDTYQSLNAKHYKDIRGTILSKLQVLDRSFGRRSELFDLVIRYEDFIRDPAGVAGVLQTNGLELPRDAAQFPRGPQQIARFAMDNSDWCRRNYLKHFGFGNLHFMEWGTLKSLRYPPVPGDTKEAIGRACPLVEAHYASLRSLADAQPAFELKTPE